MTFKYVNYIIDMAKQTILYLQIFMNIFKFEKSFFFHINHTLKTDLLFEKAIA